MTDKAPASSAIGETVLVVEDEVLLRLVVAEYLRDCGFKVIEAARRRRGGDGAQAAGLAIDVLFSDIEMPGSMDGFALAQWTRANRPGLEVILTGSVPRAVNAAANLCEEGPMPKPYEPQSVHDRIRRLLAAVRPRRASVALCRISLISTGKFDSSRCPIRLFSPLILCRESASPIVARPAKI